VTHAFATPGTHTGTVTATDPTGLSASATATVVILARPTRPSAAPTPRITHLRQAHTRWREGSKLARLARRSRKPPVGTTFSFTLNTVASVTLTFTRSVGGRRVHHRCVAPSRGTHGKPACRRGVPAGTLTFAGGRAGTNQITFQGRLSRHHRLAPGTYTVKLTAKNASGKAMSHAITFTIITR
jgi:hypothetical protein